VSFKPIGEALPAPQRVLWQEMRTTPAGFVLYGGTALTLRLGHRRSEDFDFFSTGAFEPMQLLSRVSYLRGAKVVQAEINTLTCVADRAGPVPVSFFGGLPLRRIGEPDAHPQNGVQVASLLDLAGC
jgi:nucleotidyltransferase AbiEii toxin of type IV toxin-antitoxin system